MHPTFPLLKHTDFPPLTRSAVETLQVNMSHHCNQSCAHYRVNAGQNREQDNE